MPNITQVIEDYYHALTMSMITVAFIIYLSFYDQFEGLLGFVINIAPPMIFVFGSILVIAYDKGAINRRRIKGEEEEVIYITYLDALITDLIAFGSAIVILIIPPFIFKQNLGPIDIIQAVVAFIAIYWVKARFFGKIRG